MNYFIFIIVILQMGAAARSWAVGNTWWGFLWLLYGLANAVCLKLEVK